MAVIGLLAAVSTSVIISSQMFRQADAQGGGGTYRVEFTKVTILDDNDPDSRIFGSDNGEFKLFGVVNGQQKYLDTCNAPSPSRTCDGAMYSVTNGEVVRFANKYIDVTIPQGGVLNVAAYGLEYDGKRWTVPRPPAWDASYCHTLAGSPSCDYIFQIINSPSWISTFDTNDQIGYVNHAYAGPNYERSNVNAFSHTDEYILTYKITRL